MMGKWWKRKRKLTASGFFPFFGVISTLRYLRILLEDCQRYEDALQYLSNLDSYRAVEALKKYGKMLVTSRPEETTALLMRLCTPSADDSPSSSHLNAYDSGDSVNDGAGSEAGGSGSGLSSDPRPPAKPADFIHLFAQQPRALMVFFEYVLNSGPEPLSENILYTTLLELYLTSKLTDNVDPMAPNRAVWQMSPVGGRLQGEGEGAGHGGAPAVSAEYNDRLDKAFALLRKGWCAGGEPKYVLLSTHLPLPPLSLIFGE